MFKNENGFSLVELAIATGLAVALAATAVTILSGTTATLSSNANGAAGTSSQYNTDVLANASGTPAAPAVAVTMGAVTDISYNNGAIYWKTTGPSVGDMRFVITVTSTGEVIRDVLASSALDMNSPTGPQVELGYASNSGYYAVTRRSPDGTDHYGDITITAISVTDPSVSVSASA